METATQNKKSFEPIPNGDYLVRMVSLEERTSKTNRKMLTAKFQVVNGDFQKRIVFENFLLEHDSPKVVEINMNKLDKYAKAVGIDGGLEQIGHDLTKLSDYLETPFTATLKQKKPYNGKVDSSIAKFSRR